MVIWEVAPLKAIYLNENDVLPHIGCKAVGNAHGLLFDRLGIQIIHTFYKNDLWCYKQLSSHQQRVENISFRYRELFRRADALIVNGEGTFHHGRGEDMLAMLAAATNFGLRTYIINALVQEMGEYSEVFSGCTAIVARDPRSYAEATKYSKNVFLVPDSFVMANFAGPEYLPLSEKIAITDYLGTMPEGPGYIVDRLLMTREKSSVYYPFQSPFTSAQWRNVINNLQSTRCVVSARHHGLYAAAMAGRPIVILESNSHKMAAFREMCGDFIPVVTSFEKVEEAISLACDAEKEFQALPELFRSKNILETYASVFERRIKELPQGKVSGVAVSKTHVLPASISGSVAGKDMGGSFLSVLFRKAQSLIGIRGRYNFDSSRSAGVGESSEGSWERSYREDLLDAKRRRDPRLLPLRNAIYAIAGETGTYRRHRSFWDELARYARVRRFLVDEIAALLPFVKDPELLAKISTVASRARPDAEYYGVTLSIVQMELANKNARFKAVVEHLCNAVRADSYGECAALLEALGVMSKKQQSALVNSLIPALEERLAYKEVISLTALFLDSDISERNLLKVAHSHFMLGRYNEAITWLSKIVNDKDLVLTADHRRGRIMIHLGEYEAGWSLMNRVVDREHFTDIASRLGLPVWSPAMPKGSRIVVWFHELGGIGGELLWGQLVRQFHSITGCSLRLVVDCRLLVLFKESFPECEVLSRDEDINEIRRDADAFIFGRELTQLVVKQDSDFKQVAAHRFNLQEASRLGGHSAGELHFAISWKTTNPASAMFRNIPVREFAKHLSEFDFHYHCLQHGNIKEDLEILRAELGSRLHVETFEPSAAIEELGRGLLKMDGVITIDNTTLHIAGALGVPTFALISVPAYWQWPAAGSWSRWYDSVQLLRQDAPGHWEGVFDSLSVCMKKFAVAKSYVF